jgi:hypothetical protein
MALEIEFSDARVRARAEGTPSKATAHAGKPSHRRRRGGEGQGNLF